MPLKGVGLFEANPPKIEVAFLFTWPSFKQTSFQQSLLMIENTTLHFASGVVWHWNLGWMFPYEKFTLSMHC